MRRPGQWPRIQPAIPSSRNPTSSAGSSAIPEDCTKTHTSQITVAKTGAAVICFSVSIHWPGCGNSLVHAGFKRQQQVRRSQPQCQRGENRKGDGRGLRECESNRDTHKGRGTRSGHDRRQHAGKEASSVASPLGQAGTCAGEREADIEHSRKREPKEEEQQRHERDKAGRLKLEAPPQSMSAGAQCQQQGHDRPE